MTEDDDPTGRAKGGFARAATLSDGQRRLIAKKAAGGSLV